MENDLKLALENGKAVIAIKTDTEILKLFVADTNDELIKQFVEQQEQGDWAEYRTGEEAFLLARNQALFNHVTDFSDDIIRLKEPEQTQAEEFAEFQKFFSQSIEDITKDIKPEAYPNGFYEWDVLLFEFNNTDVKYKFEGTNSTFLELYVAK